MQTFSDRYSSIENHYKNLVETSGMSQSYIRECADYYNQLSKSEMSFERPTLAAQARGFALGYAAALS